jgi:hypothetical protein
MEENEIPKELQEEWESYLATCDSFGITPSIRRFLRYNELFPPDEYK